MPKSEITPDKRKILVVCEVKADFQPITGYLRRRGFDYESTIDRNVGAELFVSLKPAILLLRFPHLDGAVTYQKRFNQQPKSTQTIILCNLPETEKAASLIQQQVISDYSILQPIYDPHHLDACIRKAFDNAAKRAQMNTLQQQRAQYQKGLAQYQAKLRQVMGQSQERFSQSLRTQFDTFQQQMNHPEFAGIARVINEKKLNEKFHGLQEEVIEPGVKTFAQNINAEMEDVRAPLEQQAAILVVEPNPRQMRRMRATLEHHGFIVLQAEDHIQTINHLRKDVQDVNLILMSLELPNVNGVLFAARLKKDGHTTSIPIIIMAKTLSKRLVAASEKNGLSGLLAQPVDANEMLATIFEVLKPND